MDKEDAYSRRNEQKHESGLVLHYVPVRTSQTKSSKVEEQDIHMYHAGYRQTNLNTHSEPDCERESLGGSCQ
jgi:hypothetical protein